MFRGKYLSTVLLLSVLSVPLANADINSDPDMDFGNNERSEPDNRKGLYKIAAHAGSALEVLVHGIMTFGLAPNLKETNHFRKLMSWTFLTDETGSPLINNSFLLNNILLTQATRVLPLANNYVCGLMTITLEEGWYVDSVELNNGTIQNDFQFSHVGNNFYLPKNRGLTNLLMVKQLTGWTSASNAYYNENPIDLYLTISDGSKTSTLNIQKRACTPWSYGAAQADLHEGDNVSFCLTNPNGDASVSRLSSAVSSAFGKPAIMRIPGEACEEKVVTIK